MILLDKKFTGAALLLAAAILVPGLDAQTASVPLRINPGNWGSNFVDGQGRTWTPDQYGTGGGGAYHVTLDENQAVDFMLSTARDSVYDAQIVYRIPLANGSYQVNLHFVEYSKAPGARKFHVLQNGAQVLTSLDIAAEAGLNTRLVKALPVATVSNGILELIFQTQIGTATISGIEVLAGGPQPPNLAVDPTSLSFNAVTGGANPANKTFAVTNSGGGGPIAWTATETASWMTVTPGSGSTPAAAVTVSVVSSGLPTGVYNADITVSGNSQTRIIPVTLTVGDAQNLDVAPLSLSFAAAANGPNPATKTLAVSNTGGGAPIGWTATDDATWLTVSPGAGSTPATLTVTAITAGLAPGNYSATITVMGAGQTRTIPVTFDVSGAGAGTPVMRINCGNWPENYTDAQGRTWLTDRYFNISSGGAYTSSSENGLFDAVLSARRAIAVRPYEIVYQIPIANGSYQVNLHFIESAVGPGSRVFDVYQNGALIYDDFDIAAEAPLNTRLVKQLPVATVTNGILDLRMIRVIGNAMVAGIEILTAGPADPVLAVSPSTLTFAASVGGANPASQSINITNSGGGGPISWTATDDASWLTVTPGSGSTPSNGVTVSAATGSLAQGTYNATITVMGAGQTKTVAVSFVVSAPPNLVVAPASLIFSTNAGVNPAAQSISVTNTGGGGAVSWTATDDASWLTVTPGSGTTPAPSVSVSVNVAGLSPAVYTATITVQGGGQTRTVGVSLTVIAAPNLAVSPSALSFSATLGGTNPAAKTFDVTNVGTGGAISWTASDDAAWLTVSPSNGSTPSTGVTASVNIAGLNPGPYTATITVIGATQTRTIAVTLNIAANQSVLLRINSGYWPAPFTDSQNRTWTPDANYIGGAGMYSAVFDGAVLEGVLSTSRDSVYFPEFKYSIPVPNGNYQVNLHFVEHTAAPGARTFHVLQNGAPVLTNFDIRAEVPLNTRLIKPLPAVTVSNGILELTFRPGTGTARVSGVEVLSAP
ncbi:MAG: malectin domain-containing carbohydrate-binding protein [Bryobacteraceae bacterium]